MQLLPWHTTEKCSLSGFKVDETSTMALTREDNEQVCNDSCVEFFLAVDDSGYYNFEFTCIGKTLLGFRKERPAAVHAPEDIMASILRYSSLGGAISKKPG